MIAAALLALRAAYLPWINLFPEEAYYWNYAQHLDYGYLDHPPLVSWLIRLGTGILGHNEFGVRLFALAGCLVTSLYAFHLTKLLYGRHAALVALVFVQALPFFFLSGWVMTPDAPLTACWAGMLYYLARVFFERSASAWLGVGVCLGIGMLSKYTIGLLIPATLLFIVLDPASRPWLRRGLPYGAATLAALIFSPVVVWNARHHWASFAFQTTGRLEERHIFSLHALLGSALLLLTPLGVVLAGRIFLSRQSGQAAGEENDERRRRLFARVFTLVPLTVFSFFSLRHLVKLNWTGPLWLAVVPGMAAMLAAHFWKVRAVVLPVGSRIMRGCAVGTAIVLGVCYLALLQYLAFGLPGVGFYRRTELLPVGWPALARALDRQAADLRRAQPGRVLIVGLDRNFIASEAAFYAPDFARAALQTTGRHLFGRPSLMYAYWFPAREQEGATLLLVSFDRDDLGSLQPRRHCRPLGPVQEAWVRVRGEAVRPFYTRVGYNYSYKGYRGVR